jgi:hypothetical protein
LHLVTARSNIAGIPEGWAEQCGGPKVGESPIILSSIAGQYLQADVKEDFGVGLLACLMEVLGML